jgi:membrane-bound serine protease (ClpP class)
MPSQSVVDHSRLFVNFLKHEVGIASTALSPEGKVLVHGEFWNAICDERVERGEKVQVVSVKDLLLKVKKPS